MILTHYNGYLNFTVTNERHVTSVFYKCKEKIWLQHTFVWTPENVINVYINGKNTSYSHEQKSLIGNEKTGNTTTSLILGREGFNIDADFDEIRIWNKKVDAKEILWIYRSILSMHS